MLENTKGVKANEGYLETDDYMTRRYIMPLLFDNETRSRLIAEHKATPVGKPPLNGQPPVEHSQELRTLLDKFRRHPMAGKYVIVCVRMFEQYKIGVASGVRGEPVKTFDEIYSSEEACEHAIFLKRISDLMQEYG